MSINQIPGWSDTIGENIAQTPIGVYKRVPLVYKCANLVSNAASTAPLSLYNGEDEIDWMFSQPLADLFRRVTKDLQLYGRSYIHKQVDSRNNVIGLRRLNPLGIQVKVIGLNDNHEPMFEYRQNFNHNGQTESHTFGHYEVIYIRLDSEDNDVEPDVYPASVALTPGKVRDYLSTFGEKYFDSGAMPTTILSVADGASEDEVSKFQTWIKRRVSGVARAFGVIALRSEVKATQLNPSAKDLAIPELDEKSRKDVLDAFGIPEGMVERNANYASADVANRQFWDITVKPLVDLVLAAFNKQLFGETGIEIRAALEELPVYQVDESRRSAAFANYVNAGMSLEAAMWTLGIEELPEGIPLREPILPKPEDPPILDSGDSDSGFEGEDEFSDEAESESGEGDFKSVPGVATQPSMFTHLDRWKNKCMNQMRHKKNPNFDFESELIPATLKASIDGHLIEAESYDDIRHIFNHAVDLTNYYSYGVA